MALDDATPEKPEISDNERLIRTFCAQFDPPLRYVRTERINNIKFPDAYVANYWDDAKAIGITTTVYEGQIHAFIEAAGRGEETARAAGQVIAQAMALLYTQEG